MYQIRLWTVTEEQQGNTITGFLYWTWCMQFIKSYFSFPTSLLLSLSVSIYTHMCVWMYMCDLHRYKQVLNTHNFNFIIYFLLYYFQTTNISLDKVYVWKPTVASKNENNSESMVSKYILKIQFAVKYKCSMEFP